MTRLETAVSFVGCRSPCRSARTDSGAVSETAFTNVSDFGSSGLFDLVPYRPLGPNLGESARALPHRSAIVGPSSTLTFEHRRVSRGFFPSRRPLCVSRRRRLAWDAPHLQSL